MFKVPRVFLSHSTNDDHVVAEIRKALERNGVEIWADSRRLTGGDPLDPKIKKAIKSSDYFIALLSPAAVNSPWVRKEIQLGLKAKKKIIPILLYGIEPGALGLWFDGEPVALNLCLRPGGVADLLPDLLAALGLRLPADPRPRPQ